MMRRYSFNARRLVLAITSTLIASLAVAASAPAVVVTNGSTQYGVALIPSARQFPDNTANYLNGTGMAPVTSNGACADPAHSTESDILTAGSWPTIGVAKPICWHGGPVMHQNETIALEWEGQAPNTYWSTAKTYAQNFLSDVAGTSGQLGNPYSDTTQYWDGSNVQDRAAYSSVFGGGCDDNGTANCHLDGTTGSGQGNALPSAPGDCNANVLAGNNVFGGVGGGGAPATIPNNICLTDTDIQHEVTSLISNDGLISHVRSGHTPLVNVMTPPGVEVCLHADGDLCSANASDTPPPPAVSSTPGVSGATIPAGTYEVVITYVVNGTENLASAPTSITTTGPNSAITIASPPPETGVSGWYAYVSNGSGFHRQPADSNGLGDGSEPIGDGLTLQSLAGGQAPPTTPAVFCSYHGQVDGVTYVVQPWTAFTGCDEPDVPVLPPNPSPEKIEQSAGQRLVSPLSQSDMAAIVNPQLNGWFGLNGLEIDDQNACQPLGNNLDTFSFGTSGGAPYYLQREFNNTSVVDSDPYTYSGCLPNDVLNPAFVAPSSIILGDTIDLDGSGSATSLDIPNANYAWDFGDGIHASGPSVAHTYAKGGTYNITLTVTDRGGNVGTLTQAVQVLGSDGQPVPPPAQTPTTSPSPAPGSGSPGSALLNARLQLLPQSLKSVLRNGIAVRVSSNKAANGIATVWIPRAVAKKAHIKVGKALSVRIGLGTVSSITNGTVTLRLHLSRAVAAKLSHLKHFTLSVRLALVAPGSQQVAVDVAGRF